MASPHTIVASFSPRNGFPFLQLQNPRRSPHQALRPSVLQLPAFPLRPPDNRPRPTLPVELYRLIVSNITSTHDLCVLTRVSKSWQIESERILYHTLTLRRALDIIWRAQCLVSRPSLSSHVRTLSITLDQYTPLDPISRILAACSRLRCLSIRGAVWSDYSSVLDAVPQHTRLREFGCHTRGEAGIVRFLSRQPEIEQLDLSAHAFELEDLPPSSLPKLRSFNGWLATAAALARGGRPLRRLKLMDDSREEDVPELLAGLQQVDGEITTLEILMGVLRNPIEWSALESMLVSLKGLRFLGVCSLECTRVSGFFLHQRLPRVRF